MKVDPKKVTIASRLLLVAALGLTSWQAVIQNGIQQPFTYGDKALHFLAFYILAVLVDFSFPNRRFGVLKIIMLFGYGVAIEFVQSFLPYRSAETADVVADMLGSFAYAGSIPLFLRIPFYRDCRKR